MAHQRCYDRSELTDFALGKLPLDALEGIAAEVERCEMCEALLDTLDAVDDSVVSDLRGASAELSPDPALEQRLRAAQEVGRTIWRSQGEGGHETGQPGPREQGEVLLERIGQYELLERIGEGGMGTVYRAIHTRLKRPATVKLLPGGRLKHEQAVARFQREMEAAGSLDHPNLVRATDAGEEGGWHFLVMDYVDGVDLSRLVRARGPLAIGEACEFVRQAAQGLHHAHQQGLVHRDVKPSNLMITREGTVKVLDWGLARHAEGSQQNEDMTGAGQILGTGDYVAPEQGRDPRMADARSDIYALGCTLYFLLTGRAPFSGPQYDTFGKKLIAHSREPVPAICQTRPGVPGPLVAVLERMLAKDPADRFATAAEVADVLLPFVREEHLPDLSETSPHPVFGQSAQRPRVRRRKSWRLAAALVLLALGSLAAFAVIYVVTDRGTFEILTSDPDVRVLVYRDGAEVAIVDRKTGFTLRLRSGRYTLALSGGSPDLELSTNTFTLTRGGREIVSVQRKPDPPVVTKPEIVGVQPEPVPPQPAEPIRTTAVIYVSSNEDIDVTDPEGRQWHRLPVKGRGVDVSPDGRRICYSREDGDSCAIFVSRPDGSDEQRLVGHGYEPRWLDEDTIIYIWISSVETESLRSVWQVDTQTQQRRKLFDWSCVKPGGYGGCLTLSPNRRQILTNLQDRVDSPTQDLFLCDLEGGQMQTVWEDRLNDNCDHAPLWLPDGRFVWCRYKTPGRYVDDHAIVALRLGERQFQPLTDWNGCKYPLAASPDGQQILFAKGATQRGERMELWMMRADGSGAQRFTERTYQGLWSLKAVWRTVGGPTGLKGEAHVLPE